MERERERKGGRNIEVLSTKLVIQYSFTYLANVFVCFVFCGVFFFINRVKEDRECVSWKGNFIILLQCCQQYSFDIK